MNIVRARAPLRLGLAGGGTDVSPFCDQFGGYVLNATIDRYAYATISLSENTEVCFQATDQQITEIFSLEDPLSLNGKLNLHKAAYNFVIENFNGGKPIPMKISTFCDAPAGSGLGSSSTVVVVILKALTELLNLPLDDYELAQAAYRIERVDCGLQGGRQDQFAASFGGINFMEFYAGNKTVITPLRVKHWILNELESSLVLFFTGQSRESAQIISDQSSNIVRGLSNSIEAMHGMKREALTMKESLLRGDFNSVVECLRQGWENKKRSAKSVSNPKLDEIYSQVIQAGGLAGKVSGAGGGGFMMFFVPCDNRMNVLKTLSSFEGQVSNCHFTKQGATAWRV